MKKHFGFKLGVDHALCRGFACRNLFSAGRRQTAPLQENVFQARLKFPYFNSGVLFIFLALACSGCLSVANSPTPRFYALQSISAGQISKKINIAEPIIVGIGPVKIPEYLNRPQIATQTTNSVLAFAEFDRWAEPLQSALPRIISEDLSALMPAATFCTSPWGMDIPVKYQVIMDVVRLESRMDDNLSLAVQWSLINLENKKMMLMKRSKFSKPIEPHNYAGLAETLSKECAALSAEIAEALAIIQGGETK